MTTRLRSLAATDVLAIVTVLGEWSGLARAAIGIPIYAATLDAGLMAIALVVGLRWIRERPHWTSWIPVLLVSTYMLLAAVEIINPNVPSLRVGLEGFRKTAFTALGFFVVTLAPGTQGDGARRFFRIVAIGSIPALLWAVRQSVAPLPFDEQIIASSGVSPYTFLSGGVLRAFSPMPGPFHLGILAAMVSVIGLVEWRAGPRWWLAIAALGALTLGLTLTRGNVVAGTGVLLGIGLFSTLRTRRPGMLIAAATLGALAVGTAFGAEAALPIHPPTAIPAPIQTSPPPMTPSPSTASPERSQPSVPPTRSFIDRLLDPKNLEARFGYWSSFISAIAERPLTGYGTSAAADGFSRDYAGTGSRLFQPHSIYFKAALELGLGGLAVLLGIIAWMVLATVHTVRSEPALGLIAGGVLGATVISGITGPMLDAYPVNLVFWTTLGWLAIRPGVQTRVPR